MNTLGWICFVFTCFIAIGNSILLIITKDTKISSKIGIFLAIIFATLTSYYIFMTLR